jgi:aspartyl-tRNA(Asn)/glutamyl-tRNA(Gln) amidotransferase subunit C
MATTITAAEIRHLASLSALQLTDEEVAKYQHDLEAIVPYVRQLEEIDTTGVEPLLHPIPGAISELTHSVSPYADPD